VFPVRYGLVFCVLFTNPSGLPSGSKICVMSSAGFGTKNNCAGEGRQQFSSHFVFVISDQMPSAILIFFL
jgi:hypothetical protein